MTRQHSPFILYQRAKKLRKTQKRKPIYYYQYRLADGSLSNPLSTGCTSRTEAFQYVQRLIDKGTIQCGSDSMFRSYAVAFYREDSTWVKDKKALGTRNRPGIGEIQIRKYQGFVTHYFIKYLPNKLLSSFTPSDIKEFRQKLLEKEKLSRKTINDIMSCLRIMFNSALDDGLIARNPFRGIKPLLTEPKPRDAFSLDEVKEIVEYFAANELIRIFLITAACTGMRLAEINSLRKANILATYIDLRDQYRGGQLLPLKTREARKIPICPELRDHLVRTMPDDKEFVFDSLPDNKASDLLRNMLIKTMPEKRREHGFCFHSLRHFANTYYLSKGIMPIKVACVLGHSTGVSSMQERYLNFTEKDYSEFYDIQSELFRFLTT